MFSALELNPRAVSNTRIACSRSSATVRDGSFSGDNGGENGSGSLPTLRQRADVSLLAFLLFPYQLFRFSFQLPADVLQSRPLVLHLVAAFGLLLVLFGLLGRVLQPPNVLAGERGAVRGATR